jgi:hypothetical protein
VQVFCALPWGSAIILVAIGSGPLPYVPRLRRA